VLYLKHCVGKQSLHTKPDMVNKILQAPKPTAFVKINTPYYKGTVKTLCMENPV